MKFDGHRCKKEKNLMRPHISSNGWVYQSIRPSILLSIYPYICHPVEDLKAENSIQGLSFLHGDICHHPTHHHFSQFYFLSSVRNVILHLESNFRTVGLDIFTPSWSSRLLWIYPFWASSTTMSQPISSFPPSKNPHFPPPSLQDYHLTSLPYSY